VHRPPTHSGPLSGTTRVQTTRVSRYQKGKTSLDFTEARDSERQWLRLGHMQVCTLLQANNHASTITLSFLQAGCTSCHPTNSVKALKAKKLHIHFWYYNSFTIHFFVFWTHYIEIVQHSFLVRHTQEYLLLEVFQAFGSPGHFCRYLQSIVKVHTLCTTLEAVLTILDMPNAEEVWDKPGNLLGRSHVPMNVLHGPAVFDRRNWGLRWPPSSAIIVVYPRNSLGLCDISVRMKQVV